MGNPNVSSVRVDIVDDAEYAAEMAKLEVLRDEALHTLAAAGETELARELLAGWDQIGAAS